MAGRCPQHEGVPNTAHLTVPLWGVKPRVHLRSKSLNSAPPPPPA